MKHALGETAVKKVRVWGSKQPPSGTIAAANMEMEKCYAEIDTEEYKKKYNRPHVAVWCLFFFFLRLMHRHRNSLTGPDLESCCQKVVSGRASPHLQAQWGDLW